MLHPLYYYFPESWTKEIRADRVVKRANISTGHEVQLPPRVLQL